EPQRSCLPLTLVPLLSDRWKGTGPRQRNLEVIVHGTLVRRMEPLKALFFPSAEIKLPWTQTRSRVVSQERKLCGFGTVYLTGARSPRSLARRSVSLAQRHHSLARRRVQLAP